MKKDIDDQVRLLKSVSWKLPAALIALGIFVRLWHLDQPQLWLDELIQLALFSEESSLIERIRNAVSNTYGAVPLDYLVQDVSIALLGRSEWSARLPAALLGCLSLPCFFSLASRNLGRSGGQAATFFLAVYPLHIFYSREARNYSLFCFLTILHLLLLHRALESGSRSRWSLYSVSGILLLYTNAFAFLVLLCEAIYLLSLWIFSPKSDQDPVPSGAVVSFLSSLVISVLAFLPWVWWAWDWTLSRASVSEAFGTIIFWWRFFKEVSGGSRPLSLLILVLAIAGVRRLLHKAPPATAVFVLSWLIVPICGVLLIDWWRGYFFAIRQILFATPALLILAAAGWLEITDSFQRQLVSIPLLLLFGTLGVGTIIISDRKEEADWKALVSYLEENVDPGDRVCAPLIKSPLHYLSPGLRPKSAELGEIESGQTGNSGAIYLVESRYQTADLRERLQRLAVPVSAARAFQGFIVYRVPAH